MKAKLFFLALDSKGNFYSGPFIGDIVECYKDDFLLNNITAKTTFERRERIEKKGICFFPRAY